MILNISIALTILVIVNLLLLKFSSNKIDKIDKKARKPVVLKPHITIGQETKPLAPTGS